MNTQPLLAPVQLPELANPMAREAHKANTRAQALVAAIELTAMELAAHGHNDFADALRARMRHALGKGL